MIDILEQIEQQLFCRAGAGLSRFYITQQTSPSALNPQTGE